MRLKSRLTITLSPDLLQQVDRMIDKESIRSRSHAIEVLLRQSLSPSVTTAVLLAGGRHKGVENPALEPIDGQALISRTVHHLQDFGIRSFIILAGRHRRKIEALMGAGERLGATLRYVTEKRPLGTAGALKRAERHLRSGPFLVVHGDVLTNMDIVSFVDFHFNENTLATIAVKPRNTEPNYGKVILQGNKIIDFREKSESQGIGIVNTGVYLFQPEVLDLIDEGKSQLETDVFPKLARLGELSAFFFQGIWFDISTPKHHRMAEARWKRRREYRDVAGA